MLIRKLVTELLEESLLSFNGFLIGTQLKSFDLFCEIRHLILQILRDYDEHLIDDLFEGLLAFLCVK